MNWLISSMVVTLCKPLVHFLSCKASATDTFFLRASPYSLGAMSHVLCPCSHLSLQNLTRWPLPTFILVQDMNRLSSVAECAIDIDARGLLGSVHLNHHLSLRAMLNLLRSSIPRPPNFLGRCSLLQLTRQ
jgi:hypothetical protein